MSVQILSVQNHIHFQGIPKKKVNILCNIYTPNKTTDIETTYNVNKSH